MLYACKAVCAPDPHPRLLAVYLYPHAAHGARTFLRLVRVQKGLPCPFTKWDCDKTLTKWDSVRYTYEDLERLNQEKLRGKDYANRPVWTGGQKLLYPMYAKKYARPEALDKWPEEAAAPASDAAA